LLEAEPSAVERHLATQLAHQGVSVGVGERRSWQHSLPALARDLCDAGLGAVEVILEHRLPLTSKRSDVILAGVHPRTGNPSYIVVELKQWTNAHRFEESDTLVTVEGARYRHTLHPSIQVAGYVDYMRDFVATLSGKPEQIQGVAYLHNAVDIGVAELLDPKTVALAPLFTGERRSGLHEHLRTLLAPAAAGAQAADWLLGSPTRPSKQLMAVAADEIRDREQFVLLDEQKVAVDLVLHAVSWAHRSDRKQVVLVTGGPGSGKSVIALSLLGDLAREGRSVVHATGSRSFTITLRRVAGKRSTRTQQLFKYFNNFMSAEKNGLDVLILDEAHRIRETSVDRYTRKEVRATARKQVDELLDAARVPVFLLDQNQVVRPGELGTPADIRAAAAAKGLEVVQVDLDAQFRSGGSEAYIKWVERLLGLRDGGPTPWEGDDAFDVDVADSPEELEAILDSKRLQGYGARITAGYAWPWSKPRADGTLVPDVRIGDWSRPWNLNDDRSVGGAPPSALWATDPAGFGQVGCVYTAQGFEYDWNGVVIADDLVWRAAANGGRGGWVMQRGRSKDPAFKKQISDADVDRLIRNAYKVLMTRGMVGTILYSTDAETLAMLHTLVGATVHRSS
jgi:DUF2075 family protein